MKQALIVMLSGILLWSCSGQEKSADTKEYSFPQVGWKIKVPTDFTILDSNQVNELNRKGVSAVEKTFDTTLDTHDTKTLITVKKGDVNYLSSTIIPFDEARDGSWSEASSNLKMALAQTFTTQMPGIKLDTSSSTKNIDGVDFQQFHLVVTYPNSKVLHTYMYSALRNGFDYGISVSYTDDKIGKQLMDIVDDSKFDKK